MYQFNGLTEKSMVPRMRSGGPDDATCKQPLEIEHVEDSTMQAREEMVELYYSIGSLLSGIDKKAIQFVGSHENEGTTTLAHEFAKTAVTTFGKRILILDADPSSPSGTGIFTKQRDNSSASVGNTLPIKQLRCGSGESALFICNAADLEMSLPVLFSSSHYDPFMDDLKRKFDIILIDSPPLSTSADALAMAGRVDGIILVVEAEKTRWPVVTNVTQKLIQSGGHILGVILNKQRYYIPSFIYKRL